MDAVFAGQAVKRAIYNWDPHSVRADEQIGLANTRGTLAGVTSLTIQLAHCREGITVKNASNLVTISCPNLIDLGV